MGIWDDARALHDRQPATVQNVRIKRDDAAVSAQITVQPIQMPRKMQTQALENKGAFV